ARARGGAGGGGSRPAPPPPWGWRPPTVSVSPRGGPPAGAASRPARAPRAGSPPGASSGTPAAPAPRTWAGLQVGAGGLLRVGGQEDRDGGQPAEEQQVGAHPRQEAVEAARRGLGIGAKEPPRLRGHRPPRARDAPEARGVDPGHGEQGQADRQAGATREPPQTTTPEVRRQEG